MAKKHKKVKSAKQENESFLSKFSFDELVPKKYQVLIVSVIIFIVFLIFFYPLYFGGKTFQSGDIITSESVRTYLESHEDGYTLWNPYVFCGMPAYAIATGFKWFNSIWMGVNIVRSIFSAPFAIDYAKWTFYLLVLAFSTFFFMRSRTKNNLISLMTALATSFSTGIIVFLYIGHVTKLVTLCMFPIILLMLFRLQNKIRFVDFLLFIVIFNIAVLGWHVQIIFYTLFSIAIYYVYYITRGIINKEIDVKELFYFSLLIVAIALVYFYELYALSIWIVGLISLAIFVYLIYVYIILKSRLLKSVIVVFFSILVALLIQSDNLSQIYEYSPYSTRGTEGIFEKVASPTEQSESDFYQYATNWSFSPGEVLTFIIPSYYGFGKSTYQGPLSQNQPVEVNTYFGQMPFVDVAMYMGVIIFFLALFSMVINWKDPAVRFLTILSAVALLISFGRTFPVLYDLMYNYFPFFDKFRVPSMMLVLVQLSFPVLAGLGIAKVISLKKENDIKAELLIRNTTFVFAGLLIFTLILSAPVKDWFIGRVLASGQRGEQLKPLQDYMANMFIGDARLAFFFTAAVFGLIYVYVKSKLSADMMIIGITLLVVIDLVRIDLRGETYVNYSDIEQKFNKPEYVSAIESFKDKGTFRILNLKQDGTLGSVQQNSNFNAYFLIQDLYGYSGIKPRGFQDYMDVLGTPANQTLWRMANVKYLVFDSQVNLPGLQMIYSGNNTFVYQNENVLPRAYFVNSVESRPALEILNLVKNNQFDPKDIAYVEELDLVVDKPDSTAYVNIEKYADEKIILDVNASGNYFLFLGDTYMPAGWKAYIDGDETEIYRTNHNFRGIIVPNGKHKVKFIYLPESFVISKYTALALSSFTIIGLIMGFVVIGNKKDNSGGR